MKCVICRHGETRPGNVSVTLERNGTTILVRSVPADVCANCGERYFGTATTELLLKQADEASRAGVQLEVRTFAA